MKQVLSHSRMNKIILLKRRLLQSSPNVIKFMQPNSNKSRDGNEKGLKIEWELVTQTLD